MAADAETVQRLIAQSVAAADASAQ